MVRPGPVCKTSIPGSNPGGASNPFLILRARCEHGCEQAGCAILLRMAQLDAQAALVRKFFERRNLDLIRGVRETRADIAEQISTKGGTLGPVVDAVTTAFDAFARGLITDTFDLMRRSGLVIDHGCVVDPTAARTAY